MNKLRGLSLLQLELVATCARAKGVRDLARRLDLDPAAVSRRLRDVEETLGARLFLRSKTGLRLTAEGIRIAQICDAVVRQTQTIEGELGQRAPHLNWPVVTIGSRGFLNVPFAAQLARADIKNEKTRWRFVDSSPQEILAAAVAGAIDAAIHLEPWSMPATWATERVASLTWGLVARQDHPLKSKATLNDVRRHYFVGASYLNQDRVERASDIFPIKWGERLVGFEAQTTTVMRSILLSSDQIAFLPLLSVEEELQKRSLRLIVVEDMTPVTMSIYVSVHQERVLNAAYRSLIRAANDVDAINSRLARRLLSQEDPQVDVASQTVRISF